MHCACVSHALANFLPHMHSCHIFSHQRARAKGDAPKVKLTICGFLQFLRKIFSSLRKSAVFCGFVSCALQMLEIPGEGWICGNLQSTKICVLGFLCHLNSVPLRLSAPCPDSPGGSSATSPEVLTLLILSAIQGSLEVSQTSQELPGPFQRSAPVSGKPDTLW